MQNFSLTMEERSIPTSLGTKYFYYQLYRPDVRLHLELPTNNLGVYQDGVFISLLDEESLPAAAPRYVEVPKTKAVIFLDALYQASKGMEPFLSISTRLYKLLVDDHQNKAAEIDLDVELFTKIKTIYWGILQENAADALIDKGFEIVVQDAVRISTEWMIDVASGE